MPPRRTAAPKSPAPIPAWVRPAILIAAALVLVAMFTTEFADSDSWWQLKTGDYIVHHHKLPVPDPFSFTADLGKDAYPGEGNIRYFNLTHSWLSQVLFYAAYAAAGFPGVILFRAAVLAGFCIVTGLIAWRRSQSFAWAIAAAFLAGNIAVRFNADRPFVITSLLLAVTILILEERRHLWILPPLFLVWANLHGGYFIGWVPLAVYCVVERQRNLWIAGIVSVLVCGLNPNGFRAVLIPLLYQSSVMQTGLAEWQHAAFWKPEMYSVVLWASAAVLLWRRKEVRLTDWLLWLAFAAASIWAVRNVILIALIGPVVIATYIPWKRLAPRTEALFAALVIVAGIAGTVIEGQALQLRPAYWKYPKGAAEFLIEHHITAPMFNTYESGGFLLWKLWPQERVFVDGRALNEQVFADYRRIIGNDDQAQELLKKYGIEVILTNAFEAISGSPYFLPAALSDPSQKEWKLVYRDEQAVIFMRNPPPGVQPINNYEALASAEMQCSEYIRHDPNHTLCAGGLADLFSRIGDTVRAQRWASQAQALH